ncbi:MAG: DUF177 domain-containing protein [Desulfovibrionaceae bacterium]|nr:DUF177 domain-containing protein [Desulfovibrionaceae bacterium]
MKLTWFPVNAINPEGETLKIEDSSVWPEIWADNLVEFDMAGQIGSDFSGELFVLPQEDGCLVRGKLMGTMHLACSRCTEGVDIVINQVFDTFEPYPGGHFKRLTDLAPGKTHDKGRRRNEDRQDRKLEEAHQRDGLDIDPDVDEEVIREMADVRGGMEINLAALLWQELVLALPIKVLCKPDCRGFCPQCGKNLNLEACSCEGEILDPRLAVLRNLKINS